MKLILLSLALLGVSDWLMAQIAARETNSVVFHRQESKQARYEATRLETDSLELARRRRLLPKNVSLMERAFWGESGLFRITGVAPLTPESRKRELEARRIMLTLHQASGIATLGLMIATIVAGERYLGGDVALYDAKRALGRATVVAYMTTAGFSLFSPPPAIRRDEWDAISSHKLFATIHFAGMILTPILANRIASPNGDYYQKARAHQIAAYVTAAAFSASIISLAF
ncbi:MAG: hypothetical protein NZM06_01850 [Chloroherpetonaceae bacterium]|nr:hypothetical protein [Chloroherpetonaceae bacterium]MDW8437191.1 hypothetical protein [Chloroherpetonaceae bacterium]